MPLLHLNIPLRVYFLEYSLILYPIRYIELEKQSIYTLKGINMKNSLVKFVKNRRKQLGLTQVDLADRAGVGLRFVRDLEQGKQTLRLDKVNQVLSLFGHILAPVQKPEDTTDAA